jgi:hypothetical protein
VLTLGTAFIPLNERIEMKASTKTDRAWIHHTPTSILKETQLIPAYKKLYDVTTRRQITFAINQREGRHFYDTPAAKRAQLLGQLKWYATGMEGIAAQAQRAVETLVASDIPMPTINSIFRDIVEVQQAIKALISNIEHVNATWKKPSNKVPKLYDFE